MIPTKKHELDVTSTLEGREIGMTIDENSLQHIMAVLTDLYSDPLMAIVREYSTNARDAHIAAGKDDVPIEVYTPTALSPSLRVIDHGVGLSADDIEQIYSKYGASTKTNSNDFNGVLGLGCKSALTYTSQFTVAGTKDGVRTTVSVSRDEEGVGSMTILDETETDDENGVTISIAIKQFDRDSVKEKAQQFFRYWQPGTVLLNNEEPEHVTGMKIGDRITLERIDYYNAKNMLVMGGVAYPLENPSGDEDMAFGLPGGYRLIAEVPNGSVHFTPSREALNYTNRTKDVIKQLVKTFNADLADAVTKEIDAQTSKHDAVKVAVRWVNVLPAAWRQAKFMYQGTELPIRLGPGDGKTWIVSDGADHKDWYGKRTGVGKHGNVSNIEISQVEDCIFVSDFNRTFTPTVKHKLWEWCDQNSRDYPNMFVMDAGKPDSPWIDPSQVISWPDDVEPIKLPRYQNRAPRSPKGTTRLKGSYDLYENGFQKLEVAADDIANSGKTIYYVTGGNGEGYRYAKVMAELFNDDWILVYFTQRRKDKFLRTFPDAVTPYNMIRDNVNWLWEQVSDYEKQVLAYHTGHLKRHYDWVPRTVKDPELKFMLKLRGYPEKKLNRIKEIRSYALQYGNVDTTLPDLPHPMEKYPVVGRAYYYTTPRSTERQHLLMYIDMIYEMEKSTNA